MKEISPSQLNMHTNKPTATRMEKPLFFGDGNTEKKTFEQEISPPRSDMLSQFMMKDEDFPEKSIGFSDRKSKRSTGALRKKRDPNVAVHQNKAIDDPDFEKFE